MKKSTWFSILILGFVLNFSTAQIHPSTDDIPNYGRCLTANKERALCIALKHCQYLWNLLVTLPLTDSDQIYLRDSKCGYENGTVLICCPTRYRTINADTINATPKFPRPGECGNVLSNRIFGGNLTRIDEYPWMALLEYTKPGGRRGHHCGGTLINQRYVVTASHCVNGKAIPRDWRVVGVRLGEWDTGTNPDCELDASGKEDCAPPHVDVPLELIIPHPEYIAGSRNQLNDIALLRLSQDVTYTGFIRPLCLPFSSNLRSASFDGIAMDVTGWGYTEGGQSSSLKLKATIAVVPRNECQRVYGQQNVNLSHTQICAGGKKSIDSCRGDSGGPLIGLERSNKRISYYFLAGVVSFGPSPCGQVGWPGVYTRVADFVDWIEATVNL